MELTGNQMYENLKKIVKKKGWDLKDICKKMDINDSTLKSGIENKTIKLYNLLKLSEILNVDYKKIIEGEEEIHQAEEPQAPYKKENLTVLNTALQDCRKEKERAWEMVEFLKSQLRDNKKKEAG
ncbi:MAG: helix-turn-helix domain-containing protein [Bacteroidota bacterium]